MMGQASGELAWEASGVPSPQRQPWEEAAGPPHPGGPDPAGWEGENMGFLEGAGAIWSSTPNSLLTLGSHLPARHSNRVQQGMEGCCLSAPELAPPAGGGCLASHPPDCLALTQSPGTNNPPR